jgi:uncharacterized protein (TIGR02246 family)
MTTTTIAPPPSQPTAGDQAAVAFIPRRVAAAWEAKSAAAFAEVFTDTGVLILPYAFAKGPDQIRPVMAAAFAGPFHDTRLTLLPVSIEFLSSTAALFVTEGTLATPEQDELAQGTGIRVSWLIVKQHGQWLVNAYHQSGQHHE